MFLDAKQFYYNYDLDATTYKYGRIGGPQGLPVQGKYGLSTVGSSTTVTAVAGTPFDPVNIGDVIVFQKGETRIIRKVATKASGSSITVDTAVDLSGGYAGWFFYPFRIGTAATDGWHAIHPYSAVTIWVSITALSAAGGIDFTIEAASPNIDNAPVTVFTKNYAAAGTEAINIGEVAQALRIGLKGGSGFAGTDSITVWMTGEVRKAGY